MANITPYIKFDGNCREAFDFYTQVLGGELFIQAVGDSPAAEHMPAESQTSILHADLKGASFRIFGSDMFTKAEGLKAGNVAVCLHSADGDEIKAAYEKLADGGEITSPLKEEFFGMFGALTDKFGINWMFQSDKPEA